VGEELVLGISSLGENMALRRAILFKKKAGDNTAWYIHGGGESTGAVKYGKYISLVRLSMQPVVDGVLPFDVGRQIAQHIVGLSPKSIGDVPSNDADSAKLSDDETRLLHQEFLMQPGIRVYDFLKKHNAEILDYVRLECGERIENEPA
jgi:elongation factor Ts